MAAKAEGSVTTKKQDAPYTDAVKFTVEFDDGNWGSQVISSLKLSQIRSRKHSGGRAGMIHSAPHIQSMPHDIPGLHLTVDSEAGTYSLIDPLEEDSALLGRINSAKNMDDNTSHFADVGFYPARRDIPLSEHDIKQLTLEIRRKIDAELVTIKEGSVPTERQIKAMPGGEIAGWHDGLLR